MEELRNQDQEWQVKVDDLQTVLEECKSSRNKFERELKWALGGINAAMRALQNLQSPREGDDEAFSEDGGRSPSSVLEELMEQYNEHWYIL